ncbi:carboxymuconolactone decarboxylase family protein [Flavisphingomonas formosensis]|uniref:carboxymuconolactone decarboxylase family protein n=1 Tax=Flavisphingomonas formosensis TaxID=861534 RepID=UPI0012F8B7F0|nr:carboxymuconolactone decarboxylase family protein [Sphingomonas formosensis]
MSIDSNPVSRLPLIDVETMEGPAGDTLRSLPMRMNIIAMAAHASTCVIPQLMLGNAVMNTQSLPGLRRELLILLAARLDGAQYVWSQHRVIAEKLGATSAMLEAIEELDLASAAFDEAEQALLGFGKQVIESGNVADEVFERALRHFTAQEVIEAIIAIGYYMTMNRITLATRTPLEPGAAAMKMRERV